jgi:hypothetical protein
MGASGNLTRTSSTLRMNFLIRCDDNTSRRVDCGRISLDELAYKSCGSRGLEVRVEEFLYTQRSCVSISTREKERGQEINAQRREQTNIQGTVFAGVKLWRMWFRESADKDTCVGSSGGVGGGVGSLTSAAATAPPLFFPLLGVVRLGNTHACFVFAFAGGKVMADETGWRETSGDRRVGVVGLDLLMGSLLLRESGLSLSLLRLSPFGDRRLGEIDRRERGRRKGE